MSSLESMNTRETLDLRVCQIFGTRVFEITNILGLMFGQRPERREGVSDKRQIRSDVMTVQWHQHGLGCRVTVITGPSSDHRPENKTIVREAARGTGRRPLTGTAPFLGATPSASREPTRHETGWEDS